MIEKIHTLLRRSPFEPFSVLASGGSEYRVPTADHAAVNPGITRVVIFNDEDEEFSLPALHIVSIRSPHELAA